MSRPKKIDIREGSRLCNQCGTIKSLDLYHKHKGSPQGRFTACGKCRSYKMSQRVLEIQVLAGSKSIVECIKCESYIRKTSHKKCVHCRRDEHQRPEIKRDYNRQIIGSFNYSFN